MDVAPDLNVITQGYGCTSFPEYVCCGCPSYFHYGVDLSSGNASNQPQYATRPGEIWAAGQGAAPGQPGLGIAVISHMDDGHDMLYGHFWSTAVWVGQRVNVGDVVGFTGSTGYSTGPHAHIEVRSHGHLNAGSAGVVDPWPWLTFGDRGPEVTGPPAPVAIEDQAVRITRNPRPDGREDIYVLMNDGSVVHIIQEADSRPYYRDDPPGNFVALTESGWWGETAYLRGVGTDKGIWQVSYSQGAEGWAGPVQVL